MKKQHLGKIVLLLALPYLLWASSVTASLDKPLIIKGENAVFTLKAEGDDVSFPQLDTIAGYRVLGRAQSQSIRSINGKVSRYVEKSYTFAPTKSIVIPSVTVTIDGQDFSTKPLTLQVSTPKAAGKNAPVQLEMRLAKKEVYVGEPVRLDLIFKRAPDTDFAKVEIAQPQLNTFWAKQLPQSAPSTDNGYITQTYSYLLFPQEEGNYTIPATFAKLAQAQQGRRHSMFNDPFFNDPFFSSAFGRQLQWKKLFSNEAKLTVKALPNHLDIYGDFHIRADVDKQTTAANKPVNLTITIEGEGNLDDIKKFDLDIPNAVVYADEPQVHAAAQDGLYRGRFSQKIAIVADQNYTIPAISFRYFDKKEQSEKRIQTAPIDITVTGGRAMATVHQIEEKSSPKAQTAPTIEEPQTKSVKSVPLPDSDKYLYLALGALLGGVLTFIALRFKMPTKAKKSPDIIRQVERAKDDKTLFDLLLPYAHHDSVIKEALAKLEKNIYQGGNEKIDKEEILEILEEVA